MPRSPDLEAVVIPAWTTNARITHLLLTSLPRPIWDAPIPGAPRRTPGMIASHIHNARCRWIRALGGPHGVPVPTPTPAYAWRNLALDVGHILTYFVAHEAHHRGQLVMVARQLGSPLPDAIRNGLWQWKPPRSA